MPATALTAPAGTIVLNQFELKTYNGSTTANQTFAAPASTRQAISKNGKLITSDTTLAGSTRAATVHISWAASASALDGEPSRPTAREDIAEVIVYTAPITAAQQQTIESYLAIKYGITLDQTAPRNYLDSGGAVIWNAAANATTRPTSPASAATTRHAACVQRQSKSINTGEFVTIGLGTIAARQRVEPDNFAADRSFMIWGHDNASNVWGTAVTGSAAAAHAAHLEGAGDRHGRRRGRPHPEDDPRRHRADAVPQHRRDVRQHRHADRR